ASRSRRQASGPERSTRDPAKAESLTVTTTARIFFDIVQIDGRRPMREPWEDHNGDARTMSVIIAVPLLLLAQAAAGATPPAAAPRPEEVRHVDITVTDDKGRPVDDLVVQDVAVLENGN